MCKPFLLWRTSSSLSAPWHMRILGLLHYDGCYQFPVNPSCSNGESHRRQSPLLCVVLWMSLDGLITVNHCVQASKLVPTTLRCAQESSLCLCRCVLLWCARASADPEWLDNPGDEAGDVQGCRRGVQEAPWGSWGLRRGIQEMCGGLQERMPSFTKGDSDVHSDHPIEDNNFF